VLLPRPALDSDPPTYASPVAGITVYTTTPRQNDRNLFSGRSAGQKSRIKMLAWFVPSGCSGGESLLLWWMLLVLGL
jgi:hypothetical protein